MALRSANRSANRKRSAKEKKAARTHDRRNVWLLVLTTLLVIGSVVMFLPPQEKINQGLDLQGGLSVVLSAESTTGSLVTFEDMEKSRSIIESRVNALGASEATVQIQGSDQILVQIPGLSDTQEALDTIGKTGRLEFARLDSFTDEDTKTKIEEGSYSTPEMYTDGAGIQLPMGIAKGIEVPADSYTTIVSGDNITSVSTGFESELSKDYAVIINFDSTGAQAFAEATRDLAPDKGQIVIILDGRVESAPAVQSEIPDGRVEITGDYTQEAAQAMATVLESGSLPVSFEYAQSQVVGPTLGQDALRSGVLVAVVGLAIVMLYLLFFYRGLGFITAGAILIFALLYLGILATLSVFGLFSLSLAGIAGVVLTIGMAADSSILTLERFREEIKMGRSIKASSITGVRHAIITSVDADLVTMISALALFFLASASVKGFGLTLSLGIICDILMMLIFKAPLIRLLAPGSMRRNPKFWGIADSLTVGESGGFDRLNTLKKGDPEELPEPLLAAEFQAGQEAGNKKDAEDKQDAGDKREISGKQEVRAPSASSKKRPRYNKYRKWDVNFLGHRQLFLSIAVVMMIGCFAAVGVSGLRFGIEFVGGTSITFRNTSDISTEDMRTAFTEAGEPDAVIQTVNTDGEEGFLIRTSTTSAEDATDRANQVATKFELSTESFEVTTIGPDWGASVIQSSLIAFGVSIILIIIYIAIRFEYKMGVTAIIALLHDLVVIIGVYALFGREVTPNTIAALLTILGYSLYDSVVVFHRINDNMKLPDIKCTFMTMANHSINQVIVRTMNTSLTSLIPVLAMLFFGGETLKDFAFAMAIGLVVGAYSSIAIAVPLFSIWKTREPKYARLAQKFGKQVDLFQFASNSLLDSRTKAPKLAVAGASAGAAGAGLNAPEGRTRAAKSGAQKGAGQTETGSSAKKRPPSNHRYRKKK